MNLTLVIGGVRSGKSARGEALATATGLPVRYVATADASDPSMADRIAAHVARRPRDWTVCEADASLAAAADGACVLVDGLGAWIARALFHHALTPQAVLEDVARLAAGAADRQVIVVAEQAGLGLLPTDAGSRAWLDLLGEATEALAASAQRVELVVAGRPIALDGVPAQPAAERRVHGDAMVGAGDADHAVNVLAGGPPAWLRSALRAALEEDVAAYPDERAAAAALAALHGRAPEEIVPTNGAAEALWLLPGALRPSLAACVHPGFSEGEAALRQHRVPIAHVLRDPDRDFALDPTAVPDAVDLVLLGNPASPSGTLDPAAAILALRRPGRVVVVDEAFMDLVPGQAGSLADDGPDDVIVIRSLTKSLSIPGLRAGYAIAAPPLADRLRAARPPWSVNVLALAAMRVVAERPDALAAAAERASAEREDLADRLAGIARMRRWPSSANYCLVEVPDGPLVTRSLRDDGIAVRPAASFPGLGAGHLRLTARTPEENARLAASLRRAVEACP
jgi:histidinol-phosphate/aromatic aminotransferase/cobyric acid decarboxylase-like protein/adenosyl cobinamide kinase/adenosyl cobinamide phosphate guanylyltransferase